MRGSSPDGRSRPAGRLPISTGASASLAGPAGFYGGQGGLPAGAGGGGARSVVEEQHKKLALDAAGRQPVAGAGARRHRDLEAAVLVADQLVAGEALPVERIGRQLSVRLVQREREVARRRGGSADQGVAAAVERVALVVGPRQESDAVAQPHPPPP